MAPGVFRCTSNAGMCHYGTMTDSESCFISILSGSGKGIRIPF